MRATSITSAHVAAPARTADDASTTGSQDRFGRLLAYTVVAFIVALVLLVAALLKARSLLVSFALEAPLSVAQKLSIIAGASEWIVAIWIFSGVYRNLARWATIALLSLFLINSGSHLFAGDSSCGCFGDVTVRPAATMVFDLTALSTLALLGRPVRVGVSALQVPNPHHRGIRLCQTSAVIVVVAISFLFVMPIARLSGGRHDGLPPGLGIRSTILDLGILSSGAAASGEFVFTNYAKTSYEIQKIVPECGCTVVNADRTTIAPQSTLRIPVSIKATTWGSGRRRKTVAVYIAGSDNISRTINLSVTADVQSTAYLLRIAPSRIDFDDNQSADIIKIPLYIRGDKGIIDPIPSEIVLGADLSSHVPIRPAKIEHYRISRQIMLVVARPRVYRSYFQKLWMAATG